jgi:hypothetical protein
VGRRTLPVEIDNDGFAVQSDSQARQCLSVDQIRVEKQSGFELLKGGRAVRLPPPS